MGSVQDLGHPSEWHISKKRIDCQRHETYCGLRLESAYLSFEPPTCAKCQLECREEELLDQQRKPWRETVNAECCERCGVFYPVGTKHNCADWRGGTPIAKMNYSDPAIRVWADRIATLERRIESKKKEIRELRSRTNIAEKAERRLKWMLYTAAGKVVSQENSLGHGRDGETYEQHKARYIADLEMRYRAQDAIYRGERAP